jgi:ferric-dicitrate binding protein FerR (iron transport regulator)
VKDYARFSAKEFIMDEYFQSWVFNPTGNADAYWQSWLQENPHKRSDVEEARSMLLRLNFARYELPPEDVSTLWNQIRNNAAPPNRVPLFLSAKLLAWSGSVAAMLMIGLSYIFWISTESMIEHRTAFGETKTIVLPDSSTVILNSNSLLRLNAAWESTSPREVWLDGEAFFSVIHKKNNQPFKVKTGEEVDIEVLGTTFNVYHRGETKIVLNSGRIRLSLPTVQSDEKILMNPGELVEYNEKKYVKRKVDPKVYTAWTQHNLVLNRTSLREMIHMIKDNYGIDVEADERLLDQTISGSMPVTTAEKLLEQMAKAFQLKVVKEEDRIYLKE